MKILSESLSNLIVTYLESHPQTFYYDTRYPLQKSSLKYIAEHGAVSFMDMLWEDNLDNYSELYEEGIKDAFNNYKVEICNELGIDIEDFDIEDLVEYYKEDFDQYVSIEDNAQDYLKNEYATVLVTLYSNYDCISSNYYVESCGGYSFDGYFKDVIDLLKLNPAKVKKAFVEQGIKVVGKFPNYSWRDKYNFVNYKEFAEEFENNSCTGLFTILAKVSLYDMWQRELNETPIKNITIAKGNRYGVFSSWEGGGSIFDATFQNDFTINVGQIGKTEYDKIQIDLDLNSQYSFDETYGVIQKFYGEEIKINN